MEIVVTNGVKKTSDVTSLTKQISRESLAVVRSTCTLLLACLKPITVSDQSAYGMCKHAPARVGC